MAFNAPTTSHEEIEDFAAEFGFLPAEELPHHVNGEPSVLHLLSFDTIVSRPNFRTMSWGDFFARFDLLGLSFVYDQTGRNEFLRIDPGDPDPTEH